MPISVPISNHEVTNTAETYVIFLLLHTVPKALSLHSDCCTCWFLLLDDCQVTVYEGHWKDLNNLQHLTSEAQAVIGCFANIRSQLSVTENDNNDAMWNHMFLSKNIYFPSLLEGSEFCERGSKDNFKEQINIATITARAVCFPDLKWTESFLLCHQSCFQVQGIMHAYPLLSFSQGRIQNELLAQVSCYKTHWLLQQLKKHWCEQG